MTGTILKIMYELIIPRDRQAYPSLFSTLGTAGWENLTSSEYICMKARWMYAVEQSIAKKLLIEAVCLTQRV